MPDGRGTLALMYAPFLTLFIGRLTFDIEFAVVALSRQSSS